VEAFIPATKDAFSKLQEHLKLYEQALGARLNLQKAIIVPIAEQNRQSWLGNTGYIIADHREIIKYLGAPYGTKITVLQIQNFCLEKLSKRITTFLPQFIAFTGRMQIIKQVLMSMPVYHLMYLNLSSTTQTVINRLCKYFLWGYNKSGKRKTPLVSLSRLCRAKKHHGLGLKDISKQNIALLARWTTYLFTKPDNKWTKLFKANLELLHWSNKRRNHRLGYTILDEVLFDNPKNFKTLNTLEQYGLHGLTSDQSYSTGLKTQ
jgi:hypothetical protein